MTINYSLNCIKWAVEQTNMPQHLKVMIQEHVEHVREEVNCKTIQSNN